MESVSERIVKIEVMGKSLVSCFLTHGVVTKKPQHDDFKTHQYNIYGQFIVGFHILFFG